MVKDFTTDDTTAVSVLRRFSYLPVETDPNMVLEFAPGWKSYEDYLKSLISKRKYVFYAIRLKTEE
jgi:hypothetical protein